MGRLYLSPPHVTEADRSALLSAFDSNWIAPAGPHLEEFESAVAERTEVRHAVAVSSGTAALHLALLALGVGRGDEVLVSDLTFIAPANAARYVGATPIFIDSEERSWNLDPELLCEELRRGARRGTLPKALIAVDLYGQVADFEAIRDACDTYEVPVIEDAAEALGATYKGKSAGSLGDIGILSFNGNKIITTSGGGMLLSARQDWAEFARVRSTQAREPVVHYEHRYVGYNYRLSNLLAALGTSQLTQLDARVERRRELNAMYRTALAGVPGISFMPDAGWGRPNWWLTCVTIEPAEFGSTREAVRGLLERHDIESRPTWKPMHLQPVYAEARTVGGAVSERIFQQGLCLPSGSAMGSSDVDRVVDLILTAAQGL